MATSSVITQNGNATITYAFSGGGMTNHEAVVCQLNSTFPNNLTGVLISNVTAYINPTRYNCTVTTVGSQAIAFQFISNAV
ncbi:hypothetical protein [Granulicella arctica]|uniref:hypothetical protein n=1 Tax=Granulicella arctica TaxID=940613 RepID=UPI0021DFA648|nr:hypothetical protein [Granulicella arctica]